MTEEQTRPFISPTVAWRYEENPVWTEDSSARQEHRFGTSKARDIKGYDLEGFDEKGVDRAGYAASDYASNARLAQVVRPLARDLCRGFQLFVPLRVGLEVTDRVLDVLAEAYPEAKIRDMEGDDLEAIPYGTSEIVRGFSGSGEIYVGLYAVWGEGQRHIYFQCDLTSAMNREIGKPYALSCNISDVMDTEDYGRDYSNTGLADLDDVEAFVRKHVEEFKPFLSRYAICIEDDGAEGKLVAVALEQGDEEQQFEGDRIGTSLGHDEEEALTAFVGNGSVRTSVLRQMADRGIAELKDGFASTLRTR